MTTPASCFEKTSLATFVLTNIFPVISKIFHNLSYNSLTSASQVCHLWNSIARKELTKRIPFALKLIEPSKEENNENYDHYNRFVDGLMIRPSVVLRSLRCNDLNRDSGLPKSMPSDTTLLTMSAVGIIGQLDENSKSLEYERDYFEDTDEIGKVHSFLALQATEKFKCTVFKCDSYLVGKNAKIDFNSICDKDISSFVEPLIFTFVISNKIDAMVRKFITIAEKAFPHTTLNIIGGVTLSLQSQISGNKSRHEKIAGLIIDGQNINKEIWVNESVDKDKIQSGLQKMKTNLLEKLNKNELNLRHCFMMMMTCSGRGRNIYSYEPNVECDLINKVFPGMPVHGFFGNGEIAYSSNEPHDLFSNRFRPVLGYTSVFCLVHFNDEIWKS